MSTYPTDSQALRDQIDHPPPFVTILQHPDDVDVPVDNKDKTKSTVTPSPPPTSTVDDGVAAVASVGAAAETVGPPPTSTVDDGVTAAASVSTENPSTVGAAAEAAGSSDVKKSSPDVKKKSSGSFGGPHYYGSQETVVRMSSEFYSKITLWSFSVLRRWCDEFIDHKQTSFPLSGGVFHRRPSRERKWEVLVALSFISSKNVMFWVNENYSGEISDHIVKFFASFGRKNS